MTMQIPDTCIFDGRKYAIETWKGDTGCIPSNESLGIETTTQSTANWGGRINHFLVHQEMLYLFKVEAYLTQLCRDNLPINIRRETLIRYEPMHVTDSKGSRRELKEYRFEYLIYDDLFIPFTGDLFLSYPYGDLWDQPMTSDDDLSEETTETILTFTDGNLTYVS